MPLRSESKQFAVSPGEISDRKAQVLGPRRLSLALDKSTRRVNQCDSFRFHPSTFLDRWLECRPGNASGVANATHSSQRDST
jgi:hypothetical protein